MRLCYSYLENTRDIHDKQYLTSRDVLRVGFCPPGMTNCVPGEHFLFSGDVPGKYYLISRDLPGYQILIRTSLENDICTPGITICHPGIQHMSHCCCSILLVAFDAKLSGYRTAIENVKYFNSCDNWLFKSSCG